MKVKIFFLFLIFPLIFLTQNILAQDNNSQETTKLIVKYKENNNLKLGILRSNIDKDIVNRNSLLRKNNLKEIINTEVIEVKKESKDKVIENLKNDSSVEFVEEDRLLKVQSLPNDPYLTRQWQYGSTYFDIESTWDQQDQANESSATMAIIDSGADLDHPEIADRLWTNVDEIPDNGIDDDNNGYIDDYHGWNSELQNSDIEDDNGHGTAVFTSSFAVTNNNEGVAAIPKFGKIMVIKANLPTYTSRFNTSSIIRALEYANSFPEVKIINLSLGSTSLNQSEKLAVKSIVEENQKILVSSAGNDGVNIDSYPSSYNGVISTSSHSKNDFSYFSNFGRNISISAPGQEIFTASWGDTSQYISWSGTSLSSPIVSAILFLNSQKFQDYTAQELTQTLYNWTDNAFDNPSAPKDHWDNKWGFGRANVKDAYINKCENSEEIKTEAFISEIDGVELFDQYNPLPSNTYESDQVIILRGSAKSNLFTNYKIGWMKEGNPDIWSTEGVILSNDGNSQIENGELAQLDLNKLPEDSNYVISLKVYGQAVCLDNLVGQNNFTINLIKRYRLSGRVTNLSQEPKSGVIVVYYSDYENKIYESGKFNETKTDGSFDTKDKVQSKNIPAGKYFVSPVIFGEEVYIPEFIEVDLNSQNPHISNLNFVLQEGIVPTPTPTPTPSPSPTPIPTPSPTPIITPSPSPTVSPTPAPTPPNIDIKIKAPKENQNINIKRTLIVLLSKVKKATNYRYSFYQNDQLIYQRQSKLWFTTIGQYAIKKYNFQEGILTIKVEAKVNNVWSEPRQVNVNLIKKGR